MAAKPFTAEPSDVQLLVDTYIDQNAERLKELSALITEHALKYSLVGGEVVQSLLVLVHVAAALNELPDAVLGPIDHGARHIAAAILAVPDPKNDPNLS